MSGAGIGVMIRQLFGTAGARNPSDYYGRMIASAEATDSVLTLGFEDGTRIVVKDDGQSCCEARYMRTDDNPQDLVGHRLVALESNRSANESGEYWDAHEIAFLDVKTDAGVTVFSFHNEHNGYYGGFSLSVQELPPATEAKS